MKKFLINKKYKGLSLIEMLITLAILTVVILLASTTLTTLIKTSAVTSARSIARQESEFITEFLRRSIRNSHYSDVILYNVSGRTYNDETQRVEGTNYSGYTSPLAEGSIGNEIHFRPFGYERWICIAYFPKSTDSTKGFIVKSSYPDNNSPQECFNSSNSEYLQNAIVLNSPEIYVNLFELTHYTTPSKNLLITVNVETESIYEMSFAKNIKPRFFSQSLISTQKLTWE